MLRIMSAAVPVAVFLAWLPVATAQQPSPTAVTVRDTRVSVTRHGSPLDEVLVEISRQGGVRIELEIGLRELVARETTTTTFGDVTIEEALRRLLRGRHFTFVYVKDALAEVRVYGAGTGRFADIANHEREARSPEPVSVEDQIIAMFPADGADDRLLVVALHALETEKAPEILDAALRGLKGVQNVPIDKLAKFASTAQDPELAARALQLIAHHGEGEPSTAAHLSDLARTAAHPEVREEARSLLNAIDAPAPAESPAKIRRPSPRTR